VNVPRSFSITVVAVLFAILAPAADTAAIRNQGAMFKEMTGLAFEATSFKNLVIRQNSFINREKAPIALKMRGAIRAELGSGLWVEGNEWTTRNGMASPSLSYDPETTQKIVCQGNRLKN
jgi:hypothetical protein